MNKVLVIDDNLFTANRLAELLTTNGYRAKVCNHRCQILEVITTFKPSIVLLDLLLPKARGLDIGRAIKGYADIPIIFMSSAAKPQHRLASFTCGGDDFIAKPYNFKELLLRIKSILKRVLV